MDATATAVEISRAVNARQTPARDVCEVFLTRIARHDPVLGAFRTVDADGARRMAADVDGRVEAGERLPLAGVPVAVKDNICTRGLTTTAGSRMLERFVPPYNATVVTRLRAAGAVVLGKTNCDEFAMGSSTENSAFGPTCNPWAADRTPGGSSGGSAAAVAARLVPVALGSDTGGSVRQPAAHCGVVGLRPTYGRVSRYGLIAFASSFDQIGPLTRTAPDAALVLSAIAGADPADATSCPLPPIDARLDAGIEGLRVGVPRQILSEGIARATREQFEAALEQLSAGGAELLDVALPHARFAIPVYYLIATAEASANLARYDGVRFGLRSDGNTGSLGEMYTGTRRDGFGLEVKRRIMLGTFALSAGYREAYYEQAQRVRALIHGDYVRALETVHVVATPTSPTPAFRLGEKTHDPLAMYMEDVLTVGAGLAGLPAISIPCGFSPEGLPIGLQLTGAAWEEGTLLRAAAAYQRHTRWHTAEPPATSLA